MTARIELSLFSSYSDGECWRCEETYEIVAFAAFTDGDQWTCPSCADREFPGMQQIIKGLDAVHEATMLDVFTRPISGADARSITWGLRAVADLIDDVMADRVKVKLGVHIQEGVLDHEKDQYIGVMLNREIVRPTDKETTR